MKKCSTGGCRMGVTLTWPATAWVDVTAPRWVNDAPAGRQIDRGSRPRAEQGDSGRPARERVKSYAPVLSSGLRRGDPRRLRRPHDYR